MCHVLQSSRCTWVNFWINLLLIFCPFNSYRGTDIGGATAGLASVGQMCNRAASVAYIEDHVNTALGIAVATAAHEMGHSFNMLHDDGK